MPPQETVRFFDADLSLEERVNDLVARLTLEEKASQMRDSAPAIPRLGIPAYQWWNECLHGVARAGRATVLPQSIGMAATFNADLIHQAATMISDEARAKHHEALRVGNRGIYFGLTYWTPNVNIFRDPRWGRGQETYGEDPYLTARMGVAFVRGLQGDDPQTLKLVATPKHYAVHSGPEALRHEFDAEVSPRDLRETYLPAFEACVREGRAASVMGAYNRTNGEPCCASPTLIGDILRGEWGFGGYFVSDCGALEDLYKHHKVAATEAEAAALAVTHGCDLCCEWCAPGVFRALPDAVQQGLVSEDMVDQAVRRLFAARFRLGMFDPDAQNPYAHISPDVVGGEKHRVLARRVARESLVLLRNEGDLLPLRKDLRSVAVIGPSAQSTSVLLGNYFGHPNHAVTLWEGIVGAVSAGTQVQYAPGCPAWGDDHGGFDKALALAREADVVIVALGYTPDMEGEEGDVANSDGGGDRLHIGLPAIQQELLVRLHDTGKPLVLVLTGGSPIDLRWAAENVPAILMTWYSGQEGGRAVADALFGDYNPGGRLPVTFVRSLDQLPPVEDYAMAGRTYRFSDQEPLYPFGHGLSYTRFTYGALTLSRATIRPEEGVTVTVDVSNVGQRPGDEVVQLYLRDVEASVPVPRIHLAGFQRVYLVPGQTRTLTFSLTPALFAAYDEHGRPFVEAGEFVVSLGGGLPDDPNSAAVSTSLLVSDH